MMFFMGLVFMLFFFYCIHTYNYWSRRGVKQISLFSLLRMFKLQCLNQVSEVELYENLYAANSNEKIVGFYVFTSPVLMVRDPEIIKYVLIRDFDTFYSRGILELDKEPEPFLNQIFFSVGDLWKLLRKNISPAFSTGKIKGMFHQILERAEKLQHIACTADKGEIDAVDLVKRYSVDVVGACGLGIDLNTLNGEHEVVLKLCKRFFKPTKRDILVYLLKLNMPAIFKHVHIISSFLEDTTKAVVDIIMKQRNNEPSDRNDFVDLLLKLKKKGTMVGDSLTRKNVDGSPTKTEVEFTDALLTAQVFMYMAAGTDTTTSATSYTLYELGHHPEYQRKCHEEIDFVLARHGNQLTYEAIKEMKYLEACFREALRLFSPTGNFMRKCMKQYTIPGTNVTLDPGVLVVVPAQAVHMDPQYFPDPERFCPDRFYGEHATFKDAYMPFGKGPRACIGEHLAYIQSLVAVAAVLRHSCVSPVGERPSRVPRDLNTSIMQNIKAPLRIKVTLRSNSNENINKL
ncbi:cytochrome P450 6B6-like isoform X2 [Leguminivora glycinivorella]|uniref:cytochrome P450 6B6-like isoform X2 n=1 Tax=Leguminivora glycinivorella TaxID=1035111 RepID=UPI00200F84D4|nr:cytochrome P450 6B6-like isoform X2 [Leguminivora glycinivorella]